uniref:Uncharacterized protein n=1 Tax=Anopheles dirus TaxID=7168 RepID=A0A182NYK7_9DIPT
ICPSSSWLSCVRASGVGTRPPTARLFRDVLADAGGKRQRHRKRTFVLVKFCPAESGAVNTVRASDYPIVLLKSDRYGRVLASELSQSCMIDCPTLDREARTERSLHCIALRNEPMTLSPSNRRTRAAAGQ